MTGQDEKIKTDVLDDLADDSRVDASTITVSVEGGDVVLGGSVSTHDAAAAALERALGVAGIASVLNQMEVQLPGTGPVVEPEALRAPEAIERFDRFAVHPGNRGPRRGRPKGEIFRPGLGRPGRCA